MSTMTTYSVFCITANVYNYNYWAHELDLEHFWWLCSACFELYFNPLDRVW